MSNIKYFLIGVLIMVVWILAISEIAACERPDDWGCYDPWPYASTKQGECK